MEKVGGGGRKNCLLGLLGLLGDIGEDLGLVGIKVEGRGVGFDVVGNPQRKQSLFIRVVKLSPGGLRVKDCFKVLHQVYCLL